MLGLIRLPFAWAKRSSFLRYPVAAIRRVGVCNSFVDVGVSCDSTLCLYDSLLSHSASTSRTAVEIATGRFVSGFVKIDIVERDTKLPNIDACFNKQRPRLA